MILNKNNPARRVVLVHKSASFLSKGASCSDFLLRKSPRENSVKGLEVFADHILNMKNNNSVNAILCNQFCIVIGAILITCFFNASFCFAESSSVNLEIISRLETGGKKNPNACIGDDGLSLGKFQIQKNVLKEFNFYTGNKTPLSALHNEHRAAMISLWYLEERIPQILRSKNIPVTRENVILAYNGGFSKTPSKQAKSYLKKYKKIEAKL